MSFEKIMTRDETVPAFGTAQVGQLLNAQGNPTSANVDLPANTVQQVLRVEVPASAPAGTYLIIANILVVSSASGTLTTLLRSGTTNLSEYPGALPNGWFTQPILFFATKTAGATLNRNITLRSTAALTVSSGSQMLAFLVASPPPLPELRSAICTTICSALRRLGAWLGW